MAYVRVYVCSPFADASRVRRVHDLARLRGLEPVSSWADAAADGPEQLETTPKRVVRAVAAQNDRDLTSAHVVVVLAREGAGGEMFGEARLALAHGIPVVWVGQRRPLSAYREGVLRLSGITSALAALSAFAAVASAPGLDDDDRRFLIWTLIEWLGESDDANGPDTARGAVA